MCGMVGGVVEERSWLILQKTVDIVIFLLRQHMHSKCCIPSESTGNQICYCSPEGTDQRGQQEVLTRAG